MQPEVRLNRSKPAWACHLPPRWPAGTRSALLRESRTQEVGTLVSSKLREQVGPNTVKETDSFHVFLREEGRQDVLAPTKG